MTEQNSTYRVVYVEPGKPACENRLVPGWKISRRQLGDTLNVFMPMTIKPSLWAMTKQSFWAWKEIAVWKTAAFWLAPSLW